MAGGTMPDLMWAHGNTWAADRERRLAVDLTAWHRVRVTEQGEQRTVVVTSRDTRFGLGIAFGPWIDSADVKAMLDRYRVRSGQRSLVSGDAAPWKSKLRHRAKWLREHAAAGQSPVNAKILPKLFDRILETKLTVRVGVCNDLAIHRHCFDFDEVGLRNEQLWAVDSGAGVRVNINELGDLWLVGGSCHCCGENRLTVEAYDSMDQLVLTLQVINENDESKWRDHLANICHTT